MPTHLSDHDNIATSPDGKEPSSPSVDNDEEVELLGVVVSPADALTPAFKSGTQDLLSTPAVETEVTNVFAFFNPQASKKPRCNTLRDCFDITPNELGGITVKCKNCNKFGLRKWKAFNATYAREHALQCHGVAIEVRARLVQNSQAGKLNKKMSILTPPSDSTLGGESLSSIRKSSLFKASEAPYLKKLKQTTLMRNTEDGMITKMPVDEMERVYKAEVEAVLYRHEPLERLLDPMVIAALTIRHPPMKSFMPQHRNTIYNKYVVPIDMATTNELVRYFGILPGMVTVSFDGVTVNRKSKVRQSSTP